jgi:GDP/UDP-N,N'-diacetylbacillosamine 2-epimerase (hydrolysing)
MIKVLAINGSRSDWGYFKPIIDASSANENIQIDLMHCNMSPLNSFGFLSHQVETEGYEVKFKIFNAYFGDNDYATAKSIGSLISSISDILANNVYDWVLLAGDRSEQLAAASAASFMHIPIAHIQAGEKSGNIDGITRHVLGKMANIHFAANVDAQSRLIKLGEEDWRIKLTGAPQLDDIFSHEDNKSFINKYALRNIDYYVCIMHSDTEYLLETRIVFSELLDILTKRDSPVFFILPNNDAGGNIIRENILSNLRKNDVVFENLQRNNFLTLLNNCNALIGNSSCGILEAPLFKIPAINIGLRQESRFRGSNVIDCGFDKDQLKSSFDILESEEFSFKLKAVKSVYGDGPAAEKIIQHLLGVYAKHTKKEILNRDITV